MKRDFQVSKQNEGTGTYVCVGGGVKRAESAKQVQAEAESLRRQHILLSGGSCWGLTLGYRTEMPDLCFYHPHWEITCYWFIKFKLCLVCKILP